MKRIFGVFIILILFNVFFVFAFPSEFPLAALGKIDSFKDSSFTGNVVLDSNPNNLQKIYLETLPSIAKIKVYYVYDVFVPELENIEIKSPLNFNYFYEDLRVRKNDNINGFSQFFGEDFWNKFIPGEYYFDDGYGNVLTYEYSKEDLDLMISSFEDFQSNNFSLIDGTGFFINNQGYLLTNAHVVTLLDQEKEGMGDYIKSIYLDYYYMWYEKTNYDEGISQDVFEDALLEAMYLEENLQINNLKIDRIEVVVGEGDESMTFEARAIDFNQNYLDEIGGRDWALLKIDNFHSPSLLIGDSKGVSIGSDIYVFGYPWTSEGQGVSNFSQVAPTLTSGSVSSIVSSGNYKDIQMDVSIEAGNSGGPGINSRGEVVGIATSGYQGLSGTYNYLTPIEDATKNLNVLIKQGEADRLWRDGLNSFWSKNYKTSRETFTKLKEEYRFFPYVDSVLEKLNEFPDEDQGEVLNKDEGNINGEAISFVSGVFVVLGVLIVGLLIFIAIRVSNRK